MRPTRREALSAGMAALAGCARGVGRSPGAKSAVAVIKAEQYSGRLVEQVLEGARICALNVKGKRVLLKPNLVEFDPHTTINTNPVFVAAVYEAMRKLGAAEVLIGEGPGHRRDTLYLAEQAGYFRDVEEFEDHFVDLNRDDVYPVPGFLGDQDLYVPKTALSADILISLPKMKTHHWAGVTLSMKNLFGVVPGAVYGWPKNPLHYAGINRSIYELGRIFRRVFAIVDGVVGMEGNGPIQGTPKPCGVLVMGRDLAAVDATCCRLMGLDPTRVEYLQLARSFGNVDEERIEHRGERPAGLVQPFQVLERFEYLRAGTAGELELRAYGPGSNWCPS